VTAKGSGETNFAPSGSATWKYLSPHGASADQVSVLRPASSRGEAMKAAHRRRDMSDAVWERLRRHLPGKEGRQGSPAHDNRRFIDAVCWILQNGSTRREMPPDYGDWNNTHRHFRRRRDRGVWAGLLAAVMDDPDIEWLMIDASCIRAHPP